MTEHEKMLAGESFDGRATEIIALRKQGQCKRLNSPTYSN